LDTYPKKKSEKKMAEVKTESKITAPKLLVFIGMLYTIVLAMYYFYRPLGGFGLNILWGIICLVIAFLIFVSLELISFGPLKIPYQWWINLIFGVVLVVFAYFFGGSYFAGILLLLAAFVEFLMEKKPYKASKMVLLVGIGFSVYECIILFFPPLNAIAIVNAIFGLILLIILLLIIFEVVDFKILSYSWWFVLLVGFVIFIWVSPLAGGFPVTGFGGTLILIAFVLMILAL
jgi:hypothetical protein